MLSEILVGALLVAVTSAVAVLLPPLFSWLKAKAAEQTFFAKTELDDAILDALAIGISNVNDGAKKRLLAAYSDKKLDELDKKALFDEAVATARAVLSVKGVDLFKLASQEALQAIVRRLVDAKSESSASINIEE